MERIRDAPVQTRPRRSERYTIVELSMFEGRSVAAKELLMRLLFERVERELGIAPMDLEPTISQTPKHNWAFRGLLGDERVLGYRAPSSRRSKRALSRPRY